MLGMKKGLKNPNNNRTNEKKNNKKKEYRTTRKKNKRFGSRIRKRNFSKNEEQC